MTNSDSVYPLFIPPDNLGFRTPSQWSRSEATAYAAWLRSSIPERIQRLIRYFGLDEASPPVSLLGPLGELLANALVREPFSKDGRLTNQGHAVAADMGLLLATALLQEHPGLGWDIVRKPKSDVSYNRPTLVGFGAVGLDPIHVSTMQAFGVLRGTKDGTAWWRIFDYWSDQARRHKQAATASSAGTTQRRHR